MGEGCWKEREGGGKKQSENDGWKEGLGWSLQPGPEQGGSSGLRAGDWEARPGREKWKDCTEGCQETCVFVQPDSQDWRDASCDWILHGAPQL